MTARAESQWREALLTAPAAAAWAAVFQELWEIFFPEMPAKHPERELLERDRRAAEMDLLLAGSAWELWRDYEATAPRSAPEVIHFWNSTPGGKAVLILDGLSLRELPWLLIEAARRGFTVHEASVRGSELPGETTAFARALGFSGRAALANNDGGLAHYLPGARTESLGAEWASCADWLAAAPAVVLWHHWPDDRLHQLAEAGDGFARLARETATTLTSDAFWSMIGQLAAGRRLLITSDHGYAATGSFADVTDADQVAWLKSHLRGGRVAEATAAPHHWCPPLSLQLATAQGARQFALGRRKWKSVGGYPTLAHGGLSMLEVAVPYLILNYP